MSLEVKFETFKANHGLDDAAIAELLIIFNESFIELAHKLLNASGVPPQKLYVKNTGPKKWATKIAAEYANENNVTLDEFDKEKITKKDIDEFIKGKNSGVPIKSKPDRSEGSERTESPVAKTENIQVKPPNKKKETSKEKCKGITKSGEPCSRPGSEKPDGSTNCFCFRHAMDWKNYEISSDSELDDEEITTDTEITHGENNTE